MVDFGVTAEGTANERQLGFEEVVFCKALVEFPYRLFAAFGTSQSLADKLVRYTATAVVSHRSKTSQGTIV